MLGIEIGGTKLQLGIGQGQGRILALERLRVDPSRGAAGILDQIQAAFAALLAKPDLGKRQIQAVGIGFGGPVDVPKADASKSLSRSAVGTIFRSRPGSASISEVPRVVLENDADTAGLGGSPLRRGRRPFAAPLHECRQRNRRRSRRRSTNLPRVRATARSRSDT